MLQSTKRQNAAACARPSVRPPVARPSFTMPRAALPAAPRPAAASRALGALAVVGLGVGLLAASAPAEAQFQAQIPSQGRAKVSVAGEFSGHLAAVSDYRFRGVSRTFRDPAIQGGVELKLPSDFYVGTFASMVDKEIFPNSRGFEWDIYGGYRWRVAEEVTMDVGLIQYIFPTASEFSTLEGFVGATWRWLALKYYHTFSNRYFQTRNAKHTQYLNLSAVYPIASDLRLQASYGILKINNNEGDYSDYMVGIAKDWKGFTWGAAIQGTDINASFTNSAGKTRKLADDGFIVSVSKSF